MTLIETTTYQCLAHQSTITVGNWTDIFCYPRPQATPRFYLAAVEKDKIWEWPGDEANFLCLKLLLYAPTS